MEDQLLRERGMHSEKKQDRYNGFGPLLNSFSLQLFFFF